MNARYAALTLLCISILPDGVWADIDRPKAELELIPTMTTLSVSERWQYELRFRNTGEVAFPLINAQSTFFLGRQLFLDLRRTEPRDPDYLLGKGWANMDYEPREADWRTATWQAVLDEKPGGVVEPGEEIIVPYNLINFDTSYYQWKRGLEELSFRLMIGDGIWVESNRVKLTFENTSIQRDGEKVAEFMVQNPYRRTQIPAFCDLRFYRMKVGGDSYIFLSETRLGKCPEGSNLIVHTDTPSAVHIWIEFPESPEHNILFHRAPRRILEWRDPPPDSIVFPKEEPQP